MRPIKKNFCQCLPGTWLKWSCRENFLSICKSELKSTSNVQFINDMGFIQGLKGLFPPHIDDKSVNSLSIHVFYQMAKVRSQSSVCSGFPPNFLTMAGSCVYLISKCGNIFFLRCQFTSHFKNFSGLLSTFIFLSASLRNPY